MSLAKLRKIHVIIIGSVLCVGAAVASYFLMIKPQQEAFEAAKRRRDEASQVGNSQSQAQAEAELAQAYAEQARVREALDAQMARRMPRLDFSNREIGMYALWKEQMLNLGPTLERFARDPNVNVLSARFQIPAPPVSPNDPVFSQDVLVFELGDVQVMGDFKSLMNHIVRWNNCNRLVMVGPPSLAGTSPQIMASYKVTCYIYPVAKAEGPPLQIAGGAQAGAGAPGAPGAPGSAPMPPTVPTPTPAATP